jgi:uncharacterized glyoxalase superfamily protein PhnB
VANPSPGEAVEKVFRKAAMRRQSKAHGASRGRKAKTEEAPEEEKISCDTDAPSSTRFACNMSPAWVRCRLIKLAIPLLHVSNSTAAEDFYCNQLGFRREFSYRSDDSQSEPCYTGLTRDGIWLHISSFSGDGISGGVVNLIVEDVDALHAELVAKSVAIDVGPVDQTWGNREMYVRDADRNCIRFIQSY